MSIDDNQGKAEDFKLLEEEAWLKEAKVDYLITNKKGRYWLSIIYRHAEKPMHYLIKEIDHYPDYKKAEYFAQIMIRGIAKGPKSSNQTQKKHAFNICTN